MSLFLGCLFGPSAAPKAAEGAAPGRFIVKLRDHRQAPAASLKLPPNAALQPLMPTSAEPGRPGSDRLKSLFIVQTPNSSTTAEEIRQLLGADLVEYVEPDYVLEFHSMPLDSLFDHQWALYNSGQQYYAVQELPGEFDDTLTLKSGVSGVDINMLPFYAAEPEDTILLILAIIDSGSDLHHPELSGRFWQNPGEVPGNDFDDDHNGYVDDTLGFDFSGNDPTILYFQPDNDPSDDAGHGTHVAGIVAANTNTGGVVGVAPWVKFLPLKIFPNALSSIGSEAIIYAVNSGARIINASWGTQFQSLILQEAVAYARANGVFVTASIGNNGDNSLVFPAGFDETFAVGAISSSGVVTPFSSLGQHIELVAPGQDILSLRADGTDLYAGGKEPGVHIVGEDSLYYLSNGTSMAAPMVAGAAAVLWSFRPDVSLEELEMALRLGATDLRDPWAVGDTLIGFDTISGYGILNVWNSYSVLGPAGLYFVSPTPRSRHTAPVVVKIAPANGYSSGWELAWATELDAATWSVVASGDQPPVDSVAHIFSNDVPDGLIALRLTDQSGRESFTTFMLSLKNTLQMLEPLDGQELQFSIEVAGSAFGPAYDSLRVEYTFESDPTPIEVFSSTREYVADEIQTLNLSGTATGLYKVVLKGFFADSTAADTATITLTNTFSEGWPQKLTGRPTQTPICVDLEHDGVKEVIIGTTFGLHVFSGGGVEREDFPFLPNEDTRCVPAIHDLDRDGRDDIIFTTESGLHAVTPDGQYVSGFPVDCYTGSINFGYPTPSIARLGGTEPDSAIILVNGQGEILAYDFQGNPHFYSLEGWFADFANQPSAAYRYGTSTVTAADLLGDGRPEVITMYSGQYPFAAAAVYDGRTGQPALDQPEPYVIKASVNYGAVLADLNGDQLPEIIMTGYDSDLTRWIWVKTMGNIDLPGWPRALANLNGWLGNVPTVADLDRDGSPEIVISLFEFDIGAVYAFNHDGTPFRSREGRPDGEIFLYPMTLGPPAVADLIGDEYVEIALRGGYVFPGSGDEMLFVLDYQGNLIPGWPVATPNPLGTVLSTQYAPMVDDIDSDGLVELALASDNNEIYVWDFEGMTHDGVNASRLYGDRHNSSIVSVFRLPTDVADDVPILPLDFSLAQNYPNPFNPVTEIEFSLSHKADTKLEVFNVLGRRVAVLVDCQLSAGRHQATFDASRLASGVYLYRLSADDDVSSRKMVLVK